MPIDSQTLQAAIIRDLTARPSDAAAPYHPAVVADAAHVARFGATWYEPTSDGVRPVPGIRSVGLAPYVIPAVFRVEDEIQQLTVRIAQGAQSLTVAAVRNRTRWIKAQLDWLSVDDPALETTFHKLRITHHEARSVDTLVQALSQYRLLFAQQEARLRELDALDAAGLAEVDALLRDHRAQETRTSEMHVRREALMGLLEHYVRLIRVAARVVLRDHPQLLRDLIPPRVVARAAKAAATRRRNAKALEASRSGTPHAAPTPAVAPVTAPTPTTDTPAPEIPATPSADEPDAPSGVPV